MNILYILAIVILGVMSFRNFQLYNSYRKEKNFVDIYTKLLKDDANIYQDCKNYLENETVDYLITKGNIFLAYLNLINGDDTKQAIDGIDFNPLFANKKGQYDKNASARNIDVYIWLAMLLAKAKSLGKQDLIDEVYKKSAVLEEIVGNTVEYKVFKGVVAALNDNKNEDYAFLKLLLDGEYSDLMYDKRMIGLYKRIAAAFLVYNNEQVDEFAEQDLHEFAKTAIGKKIIDALQLTDRYPLVETNAPVEVENKEEDK